MLANFFTYKGRINRKKYLFTFLAIVVPGYFCLLAIGMIGTFIAEYFFQIPKSNTVMWLSMLPGAILVWTILSFPVVKRLHDISLPGWLYLFFLLSPIHTFYSGFLNKEFLKAEMLFLGMDIIIILLTFFIKGNKGPNNYGSDPLEKGTSPN